MEIVTSFDRTPIAYWRSGHGAALLLVHGAIADHTTTWRYVLNQLERRFTVYAMDRRGRGGSGDNAAYDLQREAADLCAVINSIDDPVTVLGHSYGGLCAIEAALLTSTIQHLILYESVPLRGSERYPLAVVEHLEALVAAGDHDAALTAMLREIAGLSDSEIQLLRDQHDAWEVRLRNTRSMPRELRAEHSYVFMPERFRNLTIPTLLMVGGDSPRPEHTNANGVAAALPNCTILTMAGERHVAMHTAPEMFAAAVSRFAAGDLTASNRAE